MPIETRITQSVLVIDDHQEIRELLRDILEDYGYRVREAANGREGLDAAMQRPVELVITDLVMPDVEGIETIIKLRAARPRLPILAISGTRDCYLQAAKLLGADDTLRKPLDIALFLQAVQRLLRPQGQPAGSSQTLGLPIR